MSLLADFLKKQKTMNFKKFFQKDATPAVQVVEQPVLGVLPKRMSRNDIMVQEIHNSFDIAADLALEEANTILSQKMDGKSVDLGQKLAQAGFTSVPLAKEVEKKRYKDLDAANRAEVVMKYQQKYPQYKFIFVDQVEAICKKYGLIMGRASQYIGDVPEKNINEIANFKINQDDKYLYKNYGMGSGMMWDMTNRPQAHFVTKEGMEKMNKEFRGTSIHYYFEEVPFFICAPAKDMDEQGRERKGVFSMDIPDPIVLHFVRDGFLIVSKWGIEGEDSSLTNEKMN